MWLINVFCSFCHWFFSFKFVLFSLHSRSEFIRVVECVLQPWTASSVPLLTRTQWLDWIRLLFTYSLHKYLNGQMLHSLSLPQLFTSLNSTRIDRSETCNRTTYCLVKKKVGKKTTHDLTDRLQRFVFYLFQWIQVESKEETKNTSQNIHNF